MVFHLPWYSHSLSKEGSKLYYVIQKKYFDPKKFYLAFRVPKYIASKISKNIIFEFQVDGKAKRKWAPKDDIVLLTDDIHVFQKTLERFDSIEEKHKVRVEEAKRKVQDALNDFEVEMNDEFFDFQNPSENSSENLLNTLK